MLENEGKASHGIKVKIVSVIGHGHWRSEGSWSKGKVFHSLIFLASAKVRCLSYRNGKGVPSHVVRRKKRRTVLVTKGLKHSN